MNKNKTILIVGAKSDIAIAVAYKFASEGYNLQLCSRESSQLESLSKDIAIRHEIVVSLYELDILHFQHFQEFINSLDILPDIVLCSVGILGDQKNDQVSILNSSNIIKTNYEGPCLLLGEFANLFEERGYGSIIALSSVAGNRGRASNYIYGSAKAGMTAFLSGLRGRLHHSNVNVLTILPGFVNSKMTNHLDLPRILTSHPKDIAAIIYKARFKSKQITISFWKIIMLIIQLIPEFLFKRVRF